MTKLELGLDTFGDRTEGQDGALLPHAQVLRNLVEQGVLADQVGVAFLGVGEHHRADFTVSATVASPDNALERWQLVHAVHAAIATLDRPAREVIVLRDLEGLSGEETCRTLGIEMAAMKSRLHRARLRCKLAITATEDA